MTVNPPSRDEQLAHMLIEHQVVPSRRVEECLTLLHKGKGSSLGEILLDKKYVHGQQLHAIERNLDRKLFAAMATPAKAGDGEAQSIQEVEATDYSSMVGRPLDAYLEEARRIGASDLHFQVDDPPFVRQHGSLIYLKHPVLRPEDTQRRVLEILDRSQREQLEQRGEIDFCYTPAHGRYRANVFRQRRGWDAVFRVIPQEVPTLEQLHLPPAIRGLTSYRHGLVLITGPAGCGKTTTMAALVDIVNRERHDHIITVEDPIEYVFESRNCNVDQRQVGMHTADFLTALRSAMRADPDYICVGEMRDLETISMALTAAETGHLVFGTLHTQNATHSVERIIDVFPPKEQGQIRSMVSESLRGVISQQLLPRADGRGREPAAEVLFATTAVRNLIREHKTFQIPSVVQMGIAHGMQSMDDSIAKLLSAGLITAETAHYHAEKPERFPLG